MTLIIDDINSSNSYEMYFMSLSTQTNAALLLNIVRVLVTKLRATPSQGARTYV